MEKGDERTMKVSNVTVRRRLFAAMIVSILVFTGLIVRLAYVQLVIGPELSAKAEESWRRNVPFTAKRGEIVDRNGIPLAYNISTPTVWAIPAQIVQPEETAKQLSAVLGMSEEDVYRIITKRSRIEQHPTRRAQDYARKSASSAAISAPGHCRR